MPANPDRQAPEFRIKIDGIDLPTEAVADLTWATVQDDVDWPSAFSFCLANWDAAKIEMKWSDGDLFREGKQAEIQMGYRDSLKTLIVGDVTALELSVAINQGPMLMVRGYDRSHRLMRGKKTMSFTNVKDSDIASQIASGAGLTADVEQTSETYRYVLQHNQSDAEFLRERAGRIGYEMFVQNKKLIFRARKHQEQEAAVIDREIDMIEFHPRLSTMHQAGSVQVRSWNAEQKELWIGRASSSDESAKMGGSAVGLASTEDAFGKAENVSVNHPVSSQVDADQLARGRLKEMGLRFITGEGTCHGRTDLRAGTIAKIEGMGRRFSGLYYLTSTTHRYIPGRGYRTEFQARRNST